jgi:hypothetical protein
VVATDVWRSVPWPLDRLMKLFMLSSEEGAATTLHCATSPAVANDTGLYYDNCRPVAPTALAEDVALVERLWQESERWIQ